MNTNYSVGHIRIRFESRARRRWFVVLFYALMAVLDLVCVNNRIHPPPSYLAAWIVIGLAIFVAASLIVFTWLAGPCWRDDERETHRREHAFARAYRALGVFIVAVFLAVVGLFPPGQNPIAPYLPPVIRAFLIQLPLLLLFAIVFLYVSLPPAILLWTEPDMEASK